MMIGEFPSTHPTVQVPSQWDPYDESTTDITSPFPIGSPDFNNNINPFTIPDSFGSLQRYLPSNDSDLFDVFPDLLLEAFSCDNFRMYDFKVRRCSRGRSHDWTECPFAHPGEKARRRDPRKYKYSGAACPEFRKGACRIGNACEYAHGVFECWLHPDRYRTQACKDGMGCRRRICFFAHSPDQLRVMGLQSPRLSLVNPAESYTGSPLRRSFDSYVCKGTNANTISFGGSLSPTNSPPGSPTTLSLSSSYNEMVCNMRSVQLAKASLSPTSAWGLSLIESPREGSNLRPGFSSMPTTPYRVPVRPGLLKFEQWDGRNDVNEEPVLERVESGRELRAKIYAKLSKENSFGPVRECVQLADHDVGWISDLVQ